jgi:hypothetical protein
MSTTGSIKEVLDRYFKQAIEIGRRLETHPIQPDNTNRDQSPDFLTYPLIPYR